MVQEFHVVRCFKCESFQVQQVKKLKRWNCKLCGEKQSLLKEFGRGSGADCRRHVQKLNAMRGAVIEEQDHQAWSSWDQGDEDKEDKEDSRDQVTQSHVSRWSKYLDPPEEADLEENDVMINRQEYDDPNTSDRKRKRSWLPEQSKCVSPGNVGFQATPNSLNQSSPSSLRTNDLDKTTPCSQNQLCFPNKKHNSFSSVRTGPVSRWAYFLSSDSPIQEEKEPSVNDVTDHSHHKVDEAPHPLVCVSSMFESGENFSLDDIFITDPRPKYQTKH